MKKVRQIICGLSMLILLLGAVPVDGPININAKSTVCTIKTKKIVYKDNEGNIRGVISYQYPQLQGDTAAIKKINKAIRKERDKFFTSEKADEFRSYLTDEYWIHERYFYMRRCKIRYNEGNVLSFTESEVFFAGFSSHTYYHGYNYNTKTGKKITYKNAIKGNARKKITKATKKMLKKEAMDYDKACKELKNKKHFEFYISPGKVNICYQPFELTRCGQPGTVSVKGKYN